MLPISRRDEQLESSETSPKSIAHSNTRTELTLLQPNRKSNPTTNETARAQGEEEERGGGGWRYAHDGAPGAAGDGDAEPARGGGEGEGGGAEGRRREQRRRRPGRRQLGHRAGHRRRGWWELRGRGGWDGVGRSRGSLRGFGGEMSRGALLLVSINK